MSYPNITPTNGVHAEDVALALEQKTEIVRRLIHDLRSPLSAMASTTDLLRQYFDRMTPPKRERYLERLNQSVFILDRLLARLSYLNSPQIVVQPQVTSLGELQQSLQRSASKLYSADHLAFFIDGVETQPFEADAELLQAAALELVDNAFRFGEPKSRVQITFAQRRDRLRIAVHSKGNPIAEEQQPALFEVSLPDSLSGVQAKGLGLPTAKRLAQAMDGDVVLEQNDWQGVTFAIVVTVKVR